MRMPDPRHMENFTAYTPMDTHHRPASCEEVDCDDWRNGFGIVLDPTDPLSDARAAAVRTAHRRFGEFIVIEGHVEQLQLSGAGQSEFDIEKLASLEGRVFAFPPGEACFKPHSVVREDVSPIFEHARGYQRTLPGQQTADGRPVVVDRRHEKRIVDGDEWRGRMNENADALERFRKRG